MNKTYFSNGNGESFGEAFNGKIGNKTRINMTKTNGKNIKRFFIKANGKYSEAFIEAFNVTFNKAYKA